MSTTVTDTSSHSLRKGRALLRILEHGSGPEINFAWPENHAARNNLFDIFRRCYGMHVALLGSNNLLYRLTDPAGKPWKPNMDKISGFSRIVGGKIAESEEKLIYRLKRRGFNKLNGNLAGFCDGFMASIRFKGDTPLVVSIGFKGVTSRTLDWKLSG